MAVIRDVMPVFELFQPANVNDALALLDRHGSELRLAGGAANSRRRHPQGVGTAPGIYPGEEVP